MRLFMTMSVKQKKSTSPGMAKLVSSRKGVESVTQQLKKLLSSYEFYCTQLRTLADPSLKTAIKEHADQSKLMVRFVVRTAGNDGYSSSLTPLIEAIRACRYASVKELCFWKIRIPYEDVACLVSFLKQPVCLTDYVEILDCDIDEHSIARFSSCFKVNHRLTTLVLDHTKLRDEGLLRVQEGLQATKTLLKLSLSYCGLSSRSGSLLGNLVCTTSILELFLDGNNLECEGFVDLIKLIADEAESEMQCKVSSLVLTEMGAACPGACSSYSSSKELGLTPPFSATASSANSATISTTILEKGNAKLRRPSRNCNEVSIGRRLEVLHVANNGIDSFGAGGSYAPLLAMRLLKRWIVSSGCLKDVDLDGNLIGDLASREIMEALELRKEAGFKPMHLRITHRINPDTFKRIVSLGSGPPKKRRKKRKQKLGTRRV